MLFDNKQKKLFDDAYAEYIKISDAIEQLYSFSDPFDDKPPVMEVLCDLDFYLQSILIKIAVSDGKLSDEEREFALSLPDELNAVYDRHKGYRRFLKNVTAENFEKESAPFFDYKKVPLFFELLLSEGTNDIEAILVSIETIMNSLIAIDDEISDCENAIAVETIELLKSAMNSNQKRYFEKGNVEDKNSPDLFYDENEELSLALKELDELVGLESVKKEVLDCVNLLKINNMRKEKGMPELQISKHMVFTGQAGTGKTTVARILAKIYKSLGIVSKGQLIETDRAGLVAGYVGQTALKTAHVIKKARGGVLFIDEAYTLASEEGSNDFGKEAIDTLVKGMEDYRDDLV